MMWILVIFGVRFDFQGREYDKMENKETKEKRLEDFPPFLGVGLQSYS